MEQAGRNTGGEIRIMMFPWLGHGHVSPFVELANKIVSRRPNFRVYICSSPIIVADAQPLIKHPCRIQFVELLTLPSSPDLPPHSHTTKGLPNHLFPALLTTLDATSSEFSKILTKFSPHLLISDFLQPWAPKLALSLLKIPTVVFMVIPAISTAGSLLINAGLINASGIVPDELASPPDRALWSFKWSSDVMLINSVREIEAVHMDALSKSLGKSVVPVGPLVPGDEEEEEEEKEDMVIGWLDKKDPSSVVYMSTGSEAYLSLTEIDELAHALLDLIRNNNTISFLWALKFPRGEDQVGISEALPEGFEAEVGGRVYVTPSWLPQRKILRHGSIGGFVSHCGWNSMMEGMKYGVPIMAMPLRVEQPVSARLVEELGIGIKIEKIERGEVAKVIQEVVVGRNNAVFRAKSKEISDCLMEKGDREIDDAIDCLVHLCNTFSV